MHTKIKEEKENRITQMLLGNKKTSQAIQKNILFTELHFQNFQVREVEKLKLTETLLSTKPLITMNIAKEKDMF